MKIQLYNVFVEPFKIAFSKEPIILIPLFISILLTIIFDIIGQFGPVAYFVSVMLTGIFNTFSMHGLQYCITSLKNMKKLTWEIVLQGLRNFSWYYDTFDFCRFLISIGFMAFVIPGIILALFLIFLLVFLW